MLHEITQRRYVSQDKKVHSYKSLHKKGGFSSTRTYTFHFGISSPFTYDRNTCMSFDIVRSWCYNSPIKCSLYIESWYERISNSSSGKNCLFVCINSSNTIVRDWEGYFISRLSYFMFYGSGEECEWHGIPFPYFYFVII